MSTDSAQNKPAGVPDSNSVEKGVSGMAKGLSVPESILASQEHQHLRGVFSAQEIRKVGTGTTQRKTIQKTYWFADELQSGEIQLQLLNSNYIPSGPKKTVTMEVFLEKYKPEPEFYVQTVFPKIKELNKTIARAERHRENGENFSAEFEFGNALKVDVDNVRANFGLGLTYLDRGANDKAQDIFHRLVKLDAAFEQEHKHLFNEFGINLRKNKMVDQAIDYYKRALELEKNDENIHLNLARALLEKKDYAGAAGNVLQALALSPRDDVARKFLEWLLKNKLLSAQQIEQARSILSAAPAQPVQNQAPAQPSAAQDQASAPQAPPGPASAS